MGGSRLELETIPNEDRRKEVALILKLYDFPTSIEQLEGMLVNEGSMINWTKRTTEAGLVQVKKIVNNSRGALKLVIWKNGMFCFLSKTSSLGGGSYFQTSWDLKASEVWDNLKEDVWMCISKGYRGIWEVECLIDATAKIDAEKWRERLLKIEQTETEYSAYREVDNIPRVTSTGMVPISMLDAKIQEQEKAILEVKRLEKIEETLKQKAFSNISITSNIKTTTLTIKALDDHTYSIETPIGRQWDSKDLEAYVYRHRYHWDAYTQQRTKDDTLFSDIMRRIEGMAEEPWIKLSVDGKASVELQYKKVGQNEMNLTYLNGKRVAKDDLYQTLLNYFFKGLPLVQPPEAPEVVESQKQEVASRRKQREEEMTANGIHGYITDLEGETPITIGFEKQGNEWDLIVGQKRIHLKGGMGTIKSLERVLKGTAQDYNSRHSTEELYKRLAGVIGQEEALEVIREAKQLGTLFKALELKNPR